MSWRWIGAELVYAIHDRIIAEHGGPEGVRDRNLIESAVVRPRNLAAYGKPDAADLAASYAFGFVQNHGFVDGNKRVAWVMARVFLADNGFHLQFDPGDAVAATEGLASGRLKEAEFAEWLRVRLGPKD
jgi:death-on-curing protein